MWYLLILYFVCNLNITVADEPSSPPTLQSNKMKYSAGDLINVTCVTQESYPAVNISWSLNNQTVRFRLLPPHHLPPPNTVRRPPPLTSTRSRSATAVWKFVTMWQTWSTWAVPERSSQTDVSNSAIAFGNQTGGGRESEKPDTTNVYESNRNAVRIGQNGNENDP